MKLNLLQNITVAVAAASLMLGTIGCENLPGTPKTQGAAIGGVGGAAAGAAVAGEHHRLLGAVLGGAIGAGGGYVVGANSDRLQQRDTAGAQRAVQNAQTQPATAQQAVNASTADLNGDGFVTLDEVIAMKQAGLSDQVMIDRLRATGQIFELTPEQQNQLRQAGVSDNVVRQMTDLNRDVRERLTGPQNNSIISQPAPTQPALPPTGRY